MTEWDASAGVGIESRIEATSGAARAARPCIMQAATQTNEKQLRKNKSKSFHAGAMPPAVTHAKKPQKHRPDGRLRRKDTTDCRK
jgi:hypothetical protein